jgi:hypothetical protein
MSHTVFPTKECYSIPYINKNFRRRKKEIHSWKRIKRHRFEVIRGFTNKELDSNLRKLNMIIS